MKLPILSLATAFLSGTALADVPSVAVDIAPVHSLVARVMEGVGAPDLIVAPGASPHAYSLRPSEAAALQEADLVFWMGPELTPWLSDAIGTLAEDAAVTELLEAEGTMRLELREGTLFEAHDHEGEEDHGHAHGAYDPHAWLSVGNATNWLDLIAGELSAADPENAGAYLANAAAGRDEIAALSTEIEEMLEPVRTGRFIVFHDAYQYFEDSFDIAASGAISLGDASDPGLARIEDIRMRIAAEGIDCVLAEPQFNPGLVAVVLDGTEAATGILDPLGADLEPGPALYDQLMRDMAATLSDCL